MGTSAGQEHDGIIRSPELFDPQSFHLQAGKVTEHGAYGDPPKEHDLGELLGDISCVRDPTLKSPPADDIPAWPLTRLTFSFQAEGHDIQMVLDTPHGGFGTRITELIIDGQRMDDQTASHFGLPFREIMVHLSGVHELYEQFMRQNQERWGNPKLLGEVGIFLTRSLQGADFASAFYEAIGEEPPEKDLSESAATVRRPVAWLLSFLRWKK